jgi:type IV secretory pathway TraG/TraD family ATPase VirD4
MSATRILWGQIAVVLTIVLITTWVATQWTAWRLGYQPQLGAPWFELLPGFPIYLPPAFFWWWYVYDAYAPGVFVEGACVAASGGIISKVRDVQNVADVLVDPEGSLERRNHWEKTSHGAAGRNHPSRSLCGAGQDARRRREFPVRPKAADRNHAPRDDDHAAYR